MTLNQTHVHDLTTLANFKDWASSIGAALTTFGWTQTADTGQVNWSTIASVPASGSYVYEIWQPNDGLAAYYVRFDYGNNGGNPGLKVQAGTTTNGAGTLTGYTTASCVPVTAANTGATLFNCLYCGDAGNFAMLLWRDVTNASNVAIAIERARNSTGSTTAAYFTLYCARNSSVSLNSWSQQTVVFGVGATAVQAPNQRQLFNTIVGAEQNYLTNISLNFNGNVGVMPIFPFVGYYDNPSLCFLFASQSDFSELATITTTIFGASHTYIYSKNQIFNVNSSGGGSSLGIGMRWE